MIGRVVRFRTARRIAQMVRQLAAQRALDDRFLEATDRRVEFFWRDRALAHELIENIGWDRREWRVRGQRLPFAAHRLSSCYAPHTKFRIPSLSVARGSLFEVADHLHDGIARRYWTDTQAEELISLCNRSIAAITHFVRYLRTHENI
jgi:hypothetical protein